MRAHYPINRVKGVGEGLASKFAKLRIKTVEDVINHVPFRFEDFSQLSKVRNIKPGPVTLQVKITAVHARYSRKGLHMTEALGSDETGSVKLVWFNQPYRAQSIKKDEQYFVSGEFASNYKFFAITNPACELVSNFPINTARLVPVYRLTKGLGMTQVRKTVKNALEMWQPSESLPLWLVEQEDLMPKSAALQQMHFPVDNQALAIAKRRLGFEEIFQLTLASELNKQAHALEHSYEIPFEESLIKKFVSSLPFQLTSDQRKVAWQIFQDMASGSPMNRLLEGDVGSGKTVVAALASLGAMQSGFQVAFMAPTEILATQHSKSLYDSLEIVGYHTKVVLLTGGMNKKQQDVARAAIADGSAQLIIGTHSLFQESVDFNQLGLVIVDEQHRFGVEQRKKLQSKARKMPHVLHMTATPIPRSLALTLYGELDISVLAEMPPNRKQVETKAYIAENREKVYQQLSQELDNGRQAFVVCPQIEEDEAGRLSVKKIYEQLSKKWLKNYSVGLLHGKMSSQEKDSIMQQFVSGELMVLVATTVIEVGVNVPNATVMVIEAADLFGLAQVHQLRGRVGRGRDKSYCYLVMSTNDEPSKRLRLLERENNGFKLAEYDLEMRGPGAIYGTIQHGELDLRVARLSDVELIASARKSAKLFVQKNENLLKYPELHERVKLLRTVTNLN